MSYRSNGGRDGNDRTTYVFDNNLPKEEGYTYVNTGQKDTDGRETFIRFYTGESSVNGSSAGGCLVIIGQAFLFYFLYEIFK